MTVIANDFVPIVSVIPEYQIRNLLIAKQVPYTTKVVTLGVGQRADVIVTANQPSNSIWWMRSNISTICSLSTQPFAQAAIYYEDANTTLSPQSAAWNIPDPGTCANDPLEDTVPAYSIAAATPATTKTMDINYFVNETGFFLWQLDVRLSFLHLIPQTTCNTGTHKSTGNKPARKFQLPYSPNSSRKPNC